MKGVEELSKSDYEGPSLWESLQNQVGGSNPLQTAKFSYNSLMKQLPSTTWIAYHSLFKYDYLHKKKIV